MTILFLRTLDNTQFENHKPSSFRTVYLTNFLTTKIRKRKSSPSVFEAGENSRVWRILTNLQLLEMIPNLTQLNLTLLSYNSSSNFPSQSKNHIPWDFEEAYYPDMAHENSKCPNITKLKEQEHLRAQW